MNLDIVNNKRIGLDVAGTVFGIVAIIHALRLMLRVKVLIGNHLVPQKASMTGFLGAAGLAGWMFYLGQHRAQ